MLHSLSESRGATIPLTTVTSMLMMPVSANSIKWCQYAMCRACECPKARSPLIPSHRNSLDPFHDALGSRPQVHKPHLQRSFWENLLHFQYHQYLPAINGLIRMSEVRFVIHVIWVGLKIGSPKSCESLRTLPFGGGTVTRRHLVWIREHPTSGVTG